MTTLLSDAGALGMLAALMALVLAPVVLLVRQRRGATVTLVLLALVPLALGAVGTLLGFDNIQRVVGASPGNAAPAEIAAAQSQALVSTWIGAGGTVLLVFLLACRLALGSRAE